MNSSGVSSSGVCSSLLRPWFSANFFIRLFAKSPMTAPVNAIFYYEFVSWKCRWIDWVFSTVINFISVGVATELTTISLVFYLIFNANSDSSTFVIVFLNFSVNKPHVFFNFSAPNFISSTALSTTSSSRLY